MLSGLFGRWALQSIVDTTAVGVGGQDSGKGCSRAQVPPEAGFIWETERYTCTLDSRILRAGQSYIHKTLQIPDRTRRGTREGHIPEKKQARAN